LDTFSTQGLPNGAQECQGYPEGVQGTSKASILEAFSVKSPLGITLGHPMPLQSGTRTTNESKIIEHGTQKVQFEVSLSKQAATKQTTKHVHFATKATTKHQVAAVSSQRVCFPRPLKAARVHPRKIGGIFAWILTVCNHHLLLIKTPC
jgi:hypothetical protein